MSGSTGMICIRLVSVGSILPAASILTKHLQALTLIGAWPAPLPSALRTTTAYGTKALPIALTRKNAQIPYLARVKTIGARASDWSTAASTGKVTTYSL